MKAKKEFGLDLSRISHIWQYGSVVRSWLLDLAARALEQDPRLIRYQTLGRGFRRRSLDSF